MRRVRVPPRPDFPARLAALDFADWRKADGAPYWIEDACFELTEAQVETLHEAARVCEALIADEVGKVMADARAWAALGAPAPLFALAAESHARGDPSLYGRFDFAWDGAGPPKLLEYNADTPTALYEAAVVQWQWLVDRDPRGDQYNAIHERLIDAWGRLKRGVGASGTVHFAAMGEEADDRLTAAYLADCAIQAGLKTQAIDIAEIGLKSGRLVDLDDRPISHMFKLYPWEWMAGEDAAFLAAIRAGPVGVLEPPWRLAASSKLMLARLWTAHAGHPNLLEAVATPGAITGDHVIKPAFGREGANVAALFDGKRAVHDGPFASQPGVAQSRAAMPTFDGLTPVFGVWVVAGEPCGLGIREDADPITGAGACFIPHRMV
jgi:glutathionylspermidine synthase